MINNNVIQPGRMNQQKRNILQNFQALKEHLRIKFLIPKYIYKYMPINETTFENLNENQFWLGSPLDFNDPFDCQYVFKSNCSIEELKKKIPNISRMLYDKYNKFIEWIMNNPSEKNKYLNKGINDFLRNRAGVTCFSTKYDNILMWTHYANKHTGVCLKFDTSKDSFFHQSKIINNDSIVGPLYKVKYLKKYHIIEYFGISDENLLKKQALTKSNLWKYEHEYRLISINKRKIKYNKKSLVEIIFGCELKPTDDDVKDIIKLVEFYNYPNVKFIQAIKSEDKFGLNFEEIIV